MKQIFSSLPLLLLMPAAADGSGQQEQQQQQASAADANRIIDLEGQLKAANDRIAALKRENAGLLGIVSENELPEDIEKLVRQKVAAGLTRAQALEVIRTQAAWDEQQKKTAKAK